MLLDACTSFCASLSATFGPQVAEWIAIALGALLGWWKLRKVQAAAVAGVAQAKAEARNAHIQLAEIRGSLRPAMPSLSPPASSSSGNWEPVTMPWLPDGAPKPRPSMADPRLTSDEPLPAPSPVPRDTPLDTPTAKRRT